jgi:hypothetical protein
LKDRRRRATRTCWKNYCEKKVELNRTKRGETSRLFEAIDREYNAIALEKGVDDPEGILERIKKKSRPRLAEQRALIATGP